MDKVWTFLGLSGPLDEAGEGYEPSSFSRLLAVPSKTDYVRIEFDKKYTGNKKVRKQNVLCKQKKAHEHMNCNCQTNIISMLTVHR